MASAPSKRRPTACTTPAKAAPPPSFSRTPATAPSAVMSAECQRMLGRDEEAREESESAALAEPDRKAASAPTEAEGRPRRDTATTEYPSASSSLQMALPTKPEPPRTKTWIGRSAMGERKKKVR